MTFDQTVCYNGNHLFKPGHPYCRCGYVVQDGTKPVSIEDKQRHSEQVQYLVRASRKMRDKLNDAISGPPWWLQDEYKVLVDALTAFDLVGE